MSDDYYQWLFSNAYSSYRKPVKQYINRSVEDDEDESCLDDTDIVDNTRYLFSDNNIIY